MGAAPSFLARVRGGRFGARFETFRGPVLEFAGGHFGAHQEALGGPFGGLQGRPRADALVSEESLMESCS